MPQVQDPNVVDGWYMNVSKDAEGNELPWSSATISFKPGQVRFVPASARLESRSVNESFANALASGRLLGPVDSPGGFEVSEAVPAPASEPETEDESPADEQPEPEPEPVADEQPEAEESEDEDEDLGF